MRKNRLNHNRDIMLGVMALAVVVLGVVIFFWMWCFPNGTPREDAAAMNYRFLLADGFRGDSVQLMLNDSVIFDGTVWSDSQAVAATLPKGSHVLMVFRPLSDTVSTFELPDKSSEITLSNYDEGVNMDVKDCSK